MVPRSSLRSNHLRPRSWLRKPPPCPHLDGATSRILHALGVDVVVACPTNRELLSLEPEDFFQRVLLDRFDCQAFVEGPNFHFGRNRRGDTQLLSQLCHEHQRTMAVVAAEDGDGEMISSSRIRKLLREGLVEQANRLLMEPYRLIGNVIQGEGRGRTLGFPTANLNVERVLVPATESTAVGPQSSRSHIEPPFISDRIQPLASINPKSKFTCSTVTATFTAANSKSKCSTKSVASKNSHRSINF